MLSIPLFRTANSQRSFQFRATSFTLRAEPLRSSQLKVDQRASGSRDVPLKKKLQPGLKLSVNFAGFFQTSPLVSYFFLCISTSPHPLSPKQCLASVSASLYPSRYIIPIIYGEEHRKDKTRQNRNETPPNAMKHKFYSQQEKVNCFCYFFSLF